MMPFLFSTRRAEDQPVPEKADFVIVGGGVVGTSLAYHLAKQVEIYWGFHSSSKIFQFF